MTNGFFLGEGKSAGSQRVKSFTLSDQSVSSRAAALSADVQRHDPDCMSRLFSSVEISLLPALDGKLKILHDADFFVHYFNLRNWWEINLLINDLPVGDGSCCRLLIGTQRITQNHLSEAFSLLSGHDGRDQKAGSCGERSRAA
jgi:hypothetical protein